MVLHEQPDKIHLWFKNYEAGVKSNPFMTKKSLSYVPIEGSLNHWIFYSLNEILLFMNSQKTVMMNIVLRSLHHKISFNPAIHEESKKFP